MTKRRNYTASFKSKVALEAIRGALTLPQIADKYGIAQRIVGKWKKAAMEGLPKVFAGKDTISAIRMTGMPRSGLLRNTIYGRLACM